MACLFKCKQNTAYYGSACLVGSEVYIRDRLQGACSGWPSSTFTVKSGIENMLKKMLNGKVETVEAING